MHTDVELSLFDDSDSYSPSRPSRANTSHRLRNASGDHFRHAYATMAGPSKRTRDKYEEGDRDELWKFLRSQGAVTAMIYRTEVPVSKANDIWPNFRSVAKLPARYSVLDVGWNKPDVHKPNGRAQKEPREEYGSRGKSYGLEGPSGSQSDPNTAAKTRPLWKLPVELVDQITKHLDRDDIKALRLVSPELNNYTSQSAFQTVVVPFNTEIYGMLGQGPKPDRKGKKRAKISRPEYCWKNANGDEVYNGHGLDVFRGFGQHILRYGMSFEVTEDSLSAPPVKSLTELKTSFWGTYEWPYDEYRRFETIAGLESAADETPRMKTAFSELSKVAELALSIDSGLGWLNGPDKSIRARILQKPPSIFGSRRNIPDRHTKAQHELWNYIENMYAQVGEDVRTASLYRFEGARPLTKDQEARLKATVQPTLPYMDFRIVNGATPHDLTDSLPSKILEGCETFEHSVLIPPATDAGVLFTSSTLQSDVAQVVSPVVPATLSKAQKEWLLETEWAQRAFISSYMLSIIDNPTTFHAIHTLNISSLSDRYIAMLNRTDFWTALPNLKNVVLMAIPSWRTVHKDEAGLVDTPKVDPTDQVVTFCELLRAQVAVRSNISRLTIGYTTGGEHAEGLHARNKLLMPVPLLPLRDPMLAHPPLPTETPMIQEPEILQQVLLHFPHLEELTLRNCWTTPSALVQFTKIHDKYSLKHLTLDSVSLTAVLRPAGNVNAPQAGPQPQNAAVAQQVAGHVNNGGGGNAAAAQQWATNNQLLRIYLQTLIIQFQSQANAGGMQQQDHISALQNQLQQQLNNPLAPNLQPALPNLSLAQNPGQQTQQAHGHLNPTQMTQLTQLAAQINTVQQFIAMPFAPLTNVSTGSTSSSLQMQPREGSWMSVIDQISPGTNLADFESPHSQADSTRTTFLTSISFLSCGYAKLPFYHGVDQSAIDAGNGVAAALRNSIFTKRYNALSPAMLSSKWPFLGEIVQEFDPRELAALDAAWNLRHGWDDAEAARAVEFDGLLSGGTGRFTGKVQRSDRVNIET